MIAYFSSVVFFVHSYPEIKSTEFNFQNDADAASIVLNSRIRHITIFPFDTSHMNVSVVRKPLVNLKLNKFFYCFFVQRWRFNILGKVNGPNVKLLNEVELKTYQNETVYVALDQFAIASFLFPEQMIQTAHPYDATVILEGNLRSALVVNPLSEDYNVCIIRKVSAHEFKRIMVWAANY